MNDRSSPQPVHDGDTSRQDEDQLYRLIVKRATNVAIWAGSIIHKVEVPEPNLRKRLAGGSLALSLDLYGSMCCLASLEGKSGVYVLARSVIENYARGFWLACIAKTDEIDKYSKRRMTLTLKPLLRTIRTSQFAAQSRLGIDEKDAGVFDSLTHGDIGHMLLRNINGAQIGTTTDHTASAGMLFIGATIAVSCVENYVREILDDKIRSEKLFKEGMILVAHMAE